MNRPTDRPHIPNTPAGSFPSAQPAHRRSPPANPDVAALERFARGRTRGRAPSAAESCELCGVPVPGAHDHVVDLGDRALRCACRACALLFEKSGAGAGRYRTVPDRVLRAPDPGISPAEWAQLGVPVRLVFLFENSALGRWVAVYPSPAGPVESEPRVEAWDRLRPRIPLARAIAPDVEAMLVRGERGSEALSWFGVPITAAYQLVARVRRHWTGFDGGDRARRAIDDFFADLARRSRPLGDAPGATAPGSDPGPEPAPGDVP